MSLVKGLLAGASWGENRRDEARDLARLFAAMVVVELLASVVFPVLLVGYLAVQASPVELLEVVEVLGWFLGMTLSEVLLPNAIGSLTGLGTAAAIVASYAIAVALLAIGVRGWRELEARRESR